MELLRKRTWAYISIQPERQEHFKLVPEQRDCGAVNTEAIQGHANQCTAYSVCSGLETTAPAIPNSLVINGFGDVVTG